MKRIFLSTMLIICMTSLSNAQINSYGLTFGLGSGTIIKQPLLGGPSHDLNTGFSIGLNYNRKLTNKLDLMTGLSWYNNSITVTPAFYPGDDRTPKDFNVQLLYVPLLLKIDLGKYFFINSGIIGDIDITNKRIIANQSGLGASLGIGTEYIIKRRNVCGTNFGFRN